MLVKDDNMDAQMDEYNLRWNYIPIEGAYAYRFWFKELSYNSTKIDLMLLDCVKDCFRDTNGSNVIIIDWNVSFKLINNEITTSKGVTSKEDAAIRSFRVKNFLKILPTYEILWTRKVWGIPNVKCPRCLIEEEKWEHIWICSKNSQDASEYLIFKESVNEAVDKELVEIEKEDILKFKERVLSSAIKC
ncbi:unnamed protein product [Rhizophagus irregularis]|nr:unnamed protein product [Rhizophagus irregularis]